MRVLILMVVPLLLLSSMVWAEERDCVVPYNKSFRWQTLEAHEQCRIANSLERIALLMEERQRVVEEK